MQNETLQVSSYTAVRSQMRPGDVIAFSGRGFPSDQIKMVTNSPVSHVGVILQTKVMLNGRPQIGFVNQLIESTSLNGFAGVTVSRLSDRLASYRGDCYWLPLDRARRKRANWAAFYDFLLRQDHKRYAYEPVARFLLSRIPRIGKYFVSKPDLQRFFCSELVVAGLQAAQFLPDSIDAADVTPIDLCRMAIYRSYSQLVAGQPPEFPTAVEIPAFNTNQEGTAPTQAEEAAAEQEDEVVTEQEGTQGAA